MCASLPALLRSFGRHPSPVNIGGLWQFEALGLNP